MFDTKFDIGGWVSGVASVITILMFILYLGSKYIKFIKSKELKYQELVGHYEAIKTEIYNSLAESKTQLKRQDVNIFLSSLQRQVSDLEIRSRFNLFGFLAALSFLFFNFKININQNLSAWAAGAIKSLIESVEPVSFDATQLSFFLQTFAGYTIVFVGITVLVLETKNLKKYRLLGSAIHDGIAEAMSKHIPDLDLKSPEEFVPN